jgi:hypothetical protein
MGELPTPLPLNGIQTLKDKDFWDSLREHGLRFQQVRDEAFDAFAARGGYPVAQLHETVIRRVIQHDLRIGERGRKRDQNLLEEVFRGRRFRLGEG